jgi:hypothetical protein
VPAEGVIVSHVPAAGVLPENVREFEKLADHKRCCGPDKKWNVGADDLSRPALVAQVPYFCVRL